MKSTVCAEKRKTCLRTSGDPKAGSRQNGLESLPAVQVAHSTLACVCSEFSASGGNERKRKNQRSSLFTNRLEVTVVV